MPLAPQGSREYIAGQPVDEEEQAKTEAEAAAKKKANEDAVKAAEAKQKKAAGEAEKGMGAPPETKK
jgi:hypothetical protein